ncbi:MAG: oligosaccharide flippase family protein [Rubricoccaceae bacterium]
MLRGGLLLSGANLAVKPLWILFLVGACPRLLGVEAFGTMQTALALAALGVALTDLGLSTYALRETSADPRQGRALFGRVLRYRGVLFGLACGAVLGAALVLGYRGGLLASTGAAMAFLGAQAATVTLHAFLRAYGRLGSEAAFTVLERAGTIGVGLAALYLTRSPVAVLAGMAAGMGLVAAGQAAWVRARVLPEDAVAAAGTWLMLGAVLPIGVAELLQVVYLRIDQVMIEAMLGRAAAGQYAQAYRLLEAMSLVPAILVQGMIFPRLSGLVARGEARAGRRLYRRGLAGLLLLAAAAAAVVYAAAPWLVRLLTADPAFDPAAGALRVLVLTFPFTCAKDLAFVACLAQRQHRLPIAAFGAAAVLNVGLNAGLIPVLGITGAALTTVAVEAVVAAVLVTWAWRRLHEPS